MKSPRRKGITQARPALSLVFASLRVRNYRLFWLSQLISLTGTWMQVIGQSWLVLDLTHSAQALGIVTMLQFLPLTLLVLFAGVIADRVPKRGFLIFTQSFAMLQAVLLAVLVMTGAVRLWHIYLLAALLGLNNSFDNPTRQAFVPEMVGRELVPNAVALNSALFNSARIAGPALGGATIATIGIDGTFFLNAASFLPVIAALLLMRPGELHPAVRSGAPVDVLQEVRAGLRFAFRSQQVLLVVIVLAIVGTFGYNFTVALPLLARMVLHVGSVGFGAMTSALGVGSLAAALTIAYTHRASERQLLLGAGVLSVTFALVGVSRSFPLSLILLAVLGYASIMFTATANTRMQLSAPDYLRGRLMSLYVLLFAGTTPLGSLLLGQTAHLLGVQGAVVLFAGLSALGVAIGVAYKWFGEVSRVSPPAVG
ncbi:MAG: MFS transporter [Dehalococcoidia bacterium]|nr:MFS transporter [Dehalococcoidia bacterium]